jgi:Dolichyl-phosphate-mannose-protein mannosyltransferase
MAIVRLRTIQAALAALFLIYLLQAFSPLRLVGDGMDYLLQASSAADGTGFYVHGQKSMRPSGYPLLILGLIKAGIGKPWAIVALNCLFLGIGCLATYLLLRKAFEMSERHASLVCLLTLLSFVVVRQAAQPLSDICFFGFSMACLLLIVRAEMDKPKKWWLLMLAGASLAFCIDLRTIGIALIPAFAWVLLGGMSTFAKIPTWFRQHRITSVGLSLIVLAFLCWTCVVFVHSRYFKFNQPILNHRGIAGILWSDVVDHSQELGEMTLNVPVSR